MNDTGVLRDSLKGANHRIQETPNDSAREEGKQMATVVVKPTAGKGKKKQKLRVIVCNYDGFWFAQGLEIDYAAGGRSFEEVKTNFEYGLKATITQHIKIFQNIEKLLIPAPADVWKSLTSVKKHLRFSQLSLHNEVPDLPYSGIDFYEAEQVAA